MPVLGFLQALVFLLIYSFFIRKGEKGYIAFIAVNNNFGLSPPLFF